MRRRQVHLLAVGARNDVDRIGVHDVRAQTALDGVLLGVARLDRVVSVNDERAAVAVDAVAPGAAVQRVVAVVPAEDVVPASPEDLILSVAARDGVDAVASPEDIVLSVALDLIVPRGPVSISMSKTRVVSMGRTRWFPSPSWITMREIVVGSPQSAAVASSGMQPPVADTPARSAIRM